jgi:hypothetical protein
MNAGQDISSPTCARIAALLPLLDDPGLESAAATEARAHLADCAYCQAELEQYRAIDKMLRARYGLASVPPRPTEEIMRHLTDHDGPVTTSGTPAARPPARPRLNFSGLAAVAAVLVIVTLSVLLFGARLGFGPGGHGPSGPPQYSFAGTKGVFAAVATVSSDEAWALGQVLTNWDGHSALNEVTFYHYKDGKWTPITVQTSEDFTTGGVTGFNGSISMDSATDGWAVASNYNRFEAVFRYSNGKWREVQAPDLYKIQAFSAHSAWALPAWSFGGQPQGVIAVMHYDGNSWVEQPISGVPNQSGARPIDLSMLSDQDGWALLALNQNSTQYALAHYSNGAWAVQSTFSAAEFADYSALAMASPTEGWVLGQKIVEDSNHKTTDVPLKQLLRHYVNGQWGEASLPLDGGPYFTLERIVMVSPTEGWITGVEQTVRPGTTASDYERHAIMFHYLNGQWKQVSLPQTNTAISEITDLSFTSDGHGWAAGYESDIPASDVVQDSDIMARGSPLLFSYQDGGWGLYQQQG